MKRKQSANVIMVVIIFAIIITGVLAVGFVRGWFDRDDGTSAVLTDIRGIIHLERDGIMLNAQENTVLRTGDRITNYPGATAAIQAGSTKIVLGENTELEITEADAARFVANVQSGEYFICAEQPAVLTMEGRTVSFSDSVSLLSVRAGAQSVSVFAGSVSNANQGQIQEWIGGEELVSEMNIHSLNDFAITQLRAENENQTLCFTNEDLDELQAQRLAEQQALLNTPETTAPTEPMEITEPVSEPAETTPQQTEQRNDPPAAGETTTPVTEETVQPTTEQTEPTTEETEPPTEAAPKCTISIRCDTILNNMDQLDPAKAGFVPTDGVILYTVEVEFTEGETVFDVLNRVCSVYGIQLEYSWTPMYDSYYIEGINNLYEFDCGSESGWMYKVNGWFPNYGCSSYTLSDGDAIVWCYTCVGLGADVGA